MNKHLIVLLLVAVKEGGGHNPCCRLYPCLPPPPKCKKVFFFFFFNSPSTFCHLRDVPPQKCSGAATDCLKLSFFLSPAEDWYKSSKSCIYHEKQKPFCREHYNYHKYIWLALTNLQYRSSMPRWFVKLMTSVKNIVLSINTTLCILAQNE